MVTGSERSVSSDVAISRSLPGNTTGWPSRSKSREHTSPTAERRAGEPVGTNAGVERRVRGGRADADDGAGRRWTTARAPPGSRGRSAGHGTGPGQAGPARRGTMGRPPILTATSRVISLVWYHAAGSACPPTIGATTTPGQRGQLELRGLVDGASRGHQQHVAGTQLDLAQRPGQRRGERGAEGVRGDGWSGRRDQGPAPGRCAPRGRCRCRLCGSETAIRTIPERRASESSRLTVARLVPSWPSDGGLVLVLQVVLPGGGVHQLRGEARTGPLSGRSSRLVIGAALGGRRWLG